VSSDITDFIFPLPGYILLWPIFLFSSVDHLLYHLPYVVCHKLYPSKSMSSSSYLMANGQSASLSWYQANIWDPQPIYPSLHGYIFRHLHFLWYEAPSLMRGRVCNLLIQVILGPASTVTL
jgi:hypothetical protein